MATAFLATGLGGAWLSTLVETLAVVGARGLALPGLHLGRIFALACQSHNGFPRLGTVLGRSSWASTLLLVPLPPWQLPSLAVGPAGLRGLPSASSVLPGWPRALIQKAYNCACTRCVARALASGRLALLVCFVSYLFCVRLY